MAETTTTTTTTHATPAPAPTTTPTPTPAPPAAHLPPGRFVAAPNDLPPKYVSPKSYWVTKVGGRIFSIVCSIVAIGLGAALMADARIGGFYAVFILPAAVVCIAWDIAEISCIYKRGGNRGIHPGAIVGVDLILWLGLVFISLLCISWSLINARYHVEGYGRSINDPYNDDYGTRSYRDQDENYKNPEYRALVNKINGLSKALSAFFCFLTLTHFGLFVIGCVETNIRNRMPKMVYVMAPPQLEYYVPGPPSGVLPAPYGAPMMPMQQQQQQQQQPVPMMPAQPGPVYAGEPKPPVVGGERYA
ncbi:hypothetical protein QBC40DRAFT_19966 [Triangularia verruculosa]|uniref:Uncharacterized protein n=1 Tax=Triangularia verruculosa TaxID=2587418 RepID=A0AAN7ANN0_9PEZI|nr:hypothetical protein QBC40DRAFT_19966 [Triangularia verruculosa]